MEKNYDDTFLARWLSNGLDSSELHEFLNSPDFEVYKKIASSSTKFLAPEFNNEAVFNRIQDKIKLEKKARPIFRFTGWKYAVAASVMLIIGLFYFINFSEKYVTGIGEQLTITLPDNSQVILNSKTIVSYNKEEWNKKRVIKLKGEAYFKVQKGSTFKVETNEGIVQVLGTKFNVKTTKNLFEVVCFEGKVSAESNNYKDVLIKGNAFRVIKDSLPEKWNVLQVEPSWKKGESTFKSIPIKYVIKALENQYKISFKTSKIDLEKKFTGSFTHKNLKIALQTVFVPMKIGVTFRGKKTVVLEKQ